MPRQGSSRVATGHQARCRDGLTALTALRSLQRLKVSLRGAHIEGMGCASSHAKTGQRQVSHEAVMKVQHQLDLYLVVECQGPQHVLSLPWQRRLMEVQHQVQLVLDCIMGDVANTGAAKACCRPHSPL